MTGIARRIAIMALGIATSLAIAYSLFGLGFLICTTSQATTMIGGTFSGWENVTYPEQDMAKIAEEIRSFSIDGTPSEDLYNTIFSVMQQTQPQIAHLFKDGSGNAQDLSVVAQELSLPATTDLADLESEFSLPRNALSHLEDCTPIFTTGRISVGVVGGFAIAGLIALGLLSGRKSLGRALVAGSILVIALLVALGIWASIDFNGIFTWMHSLLFAQGNWIFDSDSLLITLFPEAFWAAMAGLWIISSVILALIAGFIGKIIAH